MYYIFLLASATLLVLFSLITFGRWYLGHKQNKGPKIINIEILYQKSFHKKYMSGTLKNYPKHKKKSEANYLWHTVFLQYFAIFFHTLFCRQYPRSQLAVVLNMQLWPPQPPLSSWWAQYSHHHNPSLYPHHDYRQHQHWGGPWLAFGISHHCNGVLFFSSQRTFQHGKCEILSYFCAKLRTFGILFTGLNSMMVYQNWQIWGMAFGRQA